MLGIDVSKKTLAVTLLDPQTRQKHWQMTVRNNQAGIAQLLARAPQGAPWVLEPTGRYSLPAVKQARAAGRQVLLASPRKAKAFLASRQSRAKTDRLDSEGLAHFALSQALPSYPVNSPTVERVKQLLSARRGLSRAISSLEQQRRELTYAATALAPAIAELRARRDLLDRQIAALTEQAEELQAAQRLRAVPGIGPVVAPAITACLVSKQFERADQFVAFIGLDLAVRQSGARAGNLGLTRQGDAELRRLLYLAALANLRIKDSPFRAQYERELAKGLSTTGALCAVARKLAKLCWSLVRHNTEYDPERVYRQERFN